MKQETFICSFYRPYIKGRLIIYDIIVDDLECIEEQLICEYKRDYNK